MKKYLILILGVGVLASSCYKKLEITPPNAITTDQINEMLLTSDAATVANILEGASGGLVQALMNQDNGGSDSRSKYISGLHAMRSLQGNDIVFGAQDRSAGITTPWSHYQMENLYTSSASFNQEYYQMYFFLIARANKVIDLITEELIDNATEDNQPVLRSYKARGYIVRAWAYNMLAETYAKAHVKGGGSDPCVPIYTTFDANQDYQPASSLNDIYTMILGDLGNAIDAYAAVITNKPTPADPPTTTQGITVGTAGSATRSDFDASVAYFIRARVRLCMGDYPGAISDCDSLIKAFPTLMNESQYVAQGTAVTTPATNAGYRYFAVNSGFLKLSENPETILGWARTVAGNHHNTYFNTMGNGVGGASGCNLQIDQRLYDAMDDNDYRKKNFYSPADMTTEPLLSSHWYATSGNRVGILPYSNVKFASSIGSVGGTWTADLEKSSANSVDYTLMRISEVYLMKAEAQALYGQSPAATMDVLLAARTLAGQPTLTFNGYVYSDGNGGTLSLTDLEKVRYQWRMEMWGENGLDWFNSRRWDGVNRQTNPPTNHYFIYTIWTPEFMTLAIPERASSLNPNLR